MKKPARNAVLIGQRRQKSGAAPAAAALARK
jgi:hypothetical protein